MGGCGPPVRTRRVAGIGNVVIVVTRLGRRGTLARLAGALLLIGAAFFVATGPEASANPGAGVDAQIPLTAAQAGRSLQDASWDHLDSESCGASALAPGLVLWHFVLVPLSNATDARTVLESDQWGISDLSPSEAADGSGIQGANADWYVVNSELSAPTDLVAMTDGAVTGGRRAPDKIGTKLVVGSTCRVVDPAPVGYVQIEVVEAGADAPSVPGSYTIRYESSSRVGTVEVAGGASEVVALVPDTYVLTEVDPPPNAAVSFDVNPVVVAAGDPSAAGPETVTNNFTSPVSPPFAG